LVISQILLSTQFNFIKHIITARELKQINLKKLIFYISLFKMKGFVSISLKKNQSAILNHIFLNRLIMIKKAFSKLRI